MDAGTFSPRNLRLDGGDLEQTNWGQALFDFDAGTVSNFESLRMRGDSFVDAEAGLSVSGAVTVDAAASSFPTDAVIDMLTSTTFAAATILLDATNDVVLLEKLGAGTLGTSTSTSVLGGDTDGETAQLKLSAGTFDPTVLNLDGGANSTRAAIFDYDDGALTKPDVNMSGYVTVDIDENAADCLFDGVCFGDVLFDSTGSFNRIGGGALYTDEFLLEDDGADAVIAVTKVGSGTLSATSFKMVGGDDGATFSLAANAGGVFTR